MYKFVYIIILFLTPFLAFELPRKTFIILLENNSFNYTYNFLFSLINIPFFLHVVESPYPCNFNSNCKWIGCPIGKVGECHFGACFCIDRKVKK